MGIAPLAIAIGAGAGLGAAAFKWLVHTVTLLFSGHTDYTAAAGADNPHVPWLGPWFVLLAPVLGGLLYGPLVHRFAKETRGHGVPEVMDAVAHHGGRIAPRVAVVKALASATCIGSGGSVGKEGPIAQIGSAMGSALGRITRLSDKRMRLLVACGAAGGIAATFNAPLAGAFFAMELILCDFAIEAFGAIVLSSVTASAIGRAIFGDTTLLTLPTFEVEHPMEFLLFAGLGLAAGLVGLGFTRLLYLVEDACDRAWRGPEWLRPAVGGLLLGGLLLALPRMYGVGYPVLEKALHGGYAVWFLLVLLVGKAIATSLTLGIGGSGGVFAPSLFMGAMFGTAYGMGLHQLLPDTVGAVGAYGIVGMGAVFAGAARTPITAVIIMVELTDEYSIILPLMLAIVLATLLSRLLSGDTIYTLKLRRRGVDVTPTATHASLPEIRAAAVMERPPEALPETTPVTEAARLLALSDYGVLPVKSAQGAYRGVATARAVAETHVPDDGLQPVVGDLVEVPPVVMADMTLEEALSALNTTRGTGLPVLRESSVGLEPVGWITHRRALLALHHASSAATDPGDGPPRKTAARV